MIHEKDDICIVIEFDILVILARYLKFEEVTFYNLMHIITIYMISRAV